MVSNPEGLLQWCFCRLNALSDTKQTLINTEGFLALLWWKDSGGAVGLTGWAVIVICHILLKLSLLWQVKSAHISSILSRIKIKITTKSLQNYISYKITEHILNIRISYVERPHHPIAPGPSLAARLGARQVQVMCVGLPVSARHGTVVPRRGPPADFYCWYPPSTPVCWLFDSGGQVHQTLDTWRPRISRGSCTRLEQPPASC